TILQITVWLHSPDKVNSRATAYLGHLEYVDFLQQLSLAWEFIFLHIGPTAMTSKSGDVVNDPPSANALEGSDSVSNTRGAEVLYLSMTNFMDSRSITLLGSDPVRRRYLAKNSLLAANAMVELGAVGALLTSLQPQ